jgi:hypothetical protein
MLCETCCLKEAEPGGDECFRCRVAGVSFRFIGGGGYGRASFVGRTNQEYLNEHVGDVRREGVEKIDGRVWS